MQKFRKRISILLSILLLITVMQTTVFSGNTVAITNNRIIIIGDTQHIGFWESLYWDYWNEHNQDKTKRIIEEIASRNPALILHLGDITDNGSSQSKWRDFDEDFRPVIKKAIPVYPVFGNHEYFGNSDAMYPQFYSRFPNVAGKKWYSFTYGTIECIMINTNFGELSEKDTAEQRRWYTSKLAEMENDKAITGIIVCGHHPPFTNSTIVNADETVRNDYAIPFINSRKSAVFFSGHCHSYERFKVQGKYFIVSGGGGGPRQKLNTNANSRKFNDDFNGPSVRFLNFCQLEMQKNGLLLQVIKLNDNGSFSVADEIKINQ